MSTFWTRPRTDILKSRWPAEEASRVAAAIGDGCTRNMVIGKARRLGLTLSDGEWDRHHAVATHKRERRRKRIPRGLIVVECDGRP